MRVTTAQGPAKTAGMNGQADGGAAASGMQPAGPMQTDVVSSQDATSGQMLAGARPQPQPLQMDAQQAVQGTAGQASWPYAMPSPSPNDVLWPQTAQDHVWQSAASRALAGYVRNHPARPHNSHYAFMASVMTAEARSALPVAPFQRQWPLSSADFSAGSWEVWPIATQGSLRVSLKVPEHAEHGWQHAKASMEQLGGSLMWSSLPDSGAAYWEIEPPARRSRALAEDNIDVLTVPLTPKESAMAPSPASARAPYRRHDKTAIKAKIEELLERSIEAGEWSFTSMAAAVGIDHSNLSYQQAWSEICIDYPHRIKPRQREKRSKSSPASTEPHKKKHPIFDV